MKRQERKKKKRDVCRDVGSNRRRKRQGPTGEGESRHVKKKEKRKRKLGKGEIFMGRQPSQSGISTFKIKSFLENKIILE
jgi:hypothetical protein